jgi:hypothetical protein
MQKIILKPNGKNGNITSRMGPIRQYKIVAWIELRYSTEL